MAYNIKATNNTDIATVNDATINTTSTSLTLVGRDYAGYGQFLNENFVYLLENFASNAIPRASRLGQLWYDTSQNSLKVCISTNSAHTSNVWKPVGSTITQDTEPASGTNGDLFFNTSTNQLNVWSSGDWQLIGPPASTSSGIVSGAVVETILDSSSNSHVVIKLYISNNVVGILSYDSTYTPQVTIAGFTTINPGFNLVNSTALADSQFTGDVSNALKLNGVGSSQFIRSDQNSSTAYQLTVGGGLTVATDLNIIAVSANNEVRIESTTNDRDLNFYANVGGDSTIKPIAISGSTGSVSFEKSINVGQILTVQGNLVANIGTTVLGATTLQSSLLPYGNVNVGALASPFGNIFARSFIGDLTGNLNSVTATVTGNLSVVGAITVSGNAVATQSYVTTYVQTAGRNSQGVRTISTSAPSGGSDGDIWYQV